eukprot:TRINITY_DN3688_c0_g2_i1.p1 TRINITY_DN3688_c0_g2~~TRINITY_DN3688_c0_g2_i1.p1  ORF type:complete len:402 (+),score=57.29 TRINITY_DN3688_c0_g2_i1:34-1239(+)
MSIVTVQVGQCGNQVGHALFERLSSEIEQNDDRTVLDRFFYEGQTGRAAKYTARCVMVDMEPKVIESCREQAKQGKVFQYRKPKIQKQGGSANNWAFGYNIQGICCGETIHEEIQTELERADAIEGIQLLHSVGGGTGSGVGSFILETVRDYCPSIPIVTQSVLPFQAGEVATQHYNTLLSLSYLLKFADTVILRDNSSLVSEAKKKDSAVKANQQSRIQFTDINNAIVDSMCESCLLPTRTLSNGRVFKPCHDLVDHLTPDPRLKLIKVFSVKSERWNVAMNDLKRQCKTSLFSTITIHGELQKPTASLSRVEVSSPDTLFGPRCRQLVQKISGPPSSTLLSNTPSSRFHLENPTNKVRDMIACGAYIHHFERYGLEKHDVECAMNIVGQAIKDYETRSV